MVFVFGIRAEGYMYPGVYVPPGVHLPIQRGRFKASNKRKICIYIRFVPKYLYIYQWILFSKISIYLLL